MYYSFYDRYSPIYTQPRYLPPSKMLDADVTDSVIGEGCVIKVSYSFIHPLLEGMCQVNLLDYSLVYYGCHMT